jgi:hypothetical protein
VPGFVFIAAAPATVRIGIVKPGKPIVLLLLLLLLLPLAVLAEDARQYVELPAPMREHMLRNMRDHLLALQSITGRLAERDYDAAAEVAEQRLGMTSLQSHGASHMAKFMPSGMSDIGTTMHRAASRFAVLARDAGAAGDPGPALAALSQVMQQCVACHESYRVH